MLSRTNGTWEEKERKKKNKKTEKIGGTLHAECILTVLWMRIADHSLLLPERREGWEEERRECEKRV